MTDDAFSSYILSKGADLPVAFTDGVKNLRKTMQALYAKSSIIDESLIRQKNIATPIICDAFRRIHVLIPFALAGHSKSSRRRAA
jgi:hypothetical protein